MTKPPTYDSQMHDQGTGEVKGTPNAVSSCNALILILRGRNLILLSASPRVRVNVWHCPSTALRAHCRKFALTF